MKKFLSFGIIAVLSFLTLFSCSNGINDNSQIAASLLAQQNQISYGSIVLNGNDSRSVDYDELTSANVSVICPDKTVINGGTVSLANGAGSATINNIPTGKNRVVKVESNVTGAVLYALVDEIVSGPNPVTVNWESTALGSVYYNLIQKGTDVSSFGTSEKNSIKAKIPAVHAALVNTTAIASDYPSMSGSYVLDYGTVEVTTSGASGFTVQITDIASEKVNVTANTQSANLKAYPGTWKVKVTNGTESAEETVRVAAGDTSKVTVTYGAAVTDKIVVKVPASYGYDNVHYWKAGGSQSSTWPGKSMTLNGEYYEYELSVTTTELLFVSSNNTSKKTSDLKITEPGIFVYNGSSFDKTSGEGLKITVENPVVPELATVALPTSNISVNGGFEVTVTSNCDVTTGSIKIGSTTKNLVNGKNTFKVSDFVSSTGTYTVSGFVTNKAGTAQISGSITVVEKPVNTIVSDWNDLRIYQIMVASFQDGDSGIGYTEMHGPNEALKGGDLQGVINAISYIKELGCNAIWMTPIFPSNCADGKLNATGYFACDYFSIDSHFGTMEKFDELVTKCHENGIAVILDGVFGHNAASKNGSIGTVPNVSGVRNPGVRPSGSNPVDYAGNQDSLKYYSDVARYWITEHKIDGWRFDQCYQLAFGEHAKNDNCSTGGRNYWYDIRKVIEEAAASNGTVGQDWGTLGYIVGEHWNGDASVIQAGSVKAGSAPGYGLNGCFDFPAYYQLIQGFAQEWDGKYTGNIGNSLAYTYKTYSEKGYSCKDDDGKYDTYYPNLMLSNHDLYRIGDLINKKHNDGFESDNYAKRNMVLLAAQGAYSGPITVYYGDEIGDHNATTTTGWYGDNVARSSGKITGFNSREQKIHDFEKKVLTSRSEHPALWKGSNEQIKAESDFYVSKKQADGETIYVAFNYNSSSSKTFSASGTDLLTGTTYNGTVTVPALSAVYILAK